MHGAPWPAVWWEWGVESKGEGLGTAPVAVSQQGCSPRGRKVPVMSTSRILRCWQWSTFKNNDEEFNHKYVVLHHTQSEVWHLNTLQSTGLPRSYRKQLTWLGFILSILHGVFKVFKAYVTIWVLIYFPGKWNKKLFRGYFHHTYTSRAH